MGTAKQSPLTNGMTSERPLLAESRRDALPMNEKRKSPNCPECGSDNVTRIIFGYPSEEMAKQSERGEIVLGGCVISDDDPQWHYNDCEHES